MAFIGTIKDDRGRIVAKLVGCHDMYQFPDGSTMLIDTLPAWCQQCRTFVMVEKLKSPDEMESRAREFVADQLKNPLLPAEIMTESESERFYCKMLEDSLKEAQRWRTALSHRVSQPRCLECTNTEYVLIPWEGSWIPHPASASRKVALEQAVIRVSPSSPGRLYDTEGMRIAG